MEPILRFKADDGSDFSDWEKMTLGDVCVFVRNGYAYSSDGSRNHRYKLTRIESISGGVINDEKLGSSDEIDPRYRLVDGDILFSNINSLPYLGNVARYTNDLGEIYHGMNLLCIRPRANEINSIFLFELLGTSRIRRYEITHAKAAVNQCSLPSSDVKAMSLYCPSLPEQRKIADLLSAVDDVISAQEAEVDAWEQRKKGVMQKLFSQEVRFKADDGSDFPAWEEKVTEQLCLRMIGGGTPSTDDPSNYDGETSWISSSDLDENDIYTIRRTRFITDEAISNSATKRVKANSIVVVLRVGVGKVAISRCETCTSQDFISLEDVQGDICFIAYMLSEAMRREALQTQGTSIKGVTSKRFRSLVHMMPASIDEQRKIADCLSSMDEVIQKSKDELAKWQELKKGLLQQMFV